ncbi:MAG: helix-turn-helix domain-containing protein [Pseudobacter sp.]|uniref:helix-turn-helix domain-containing protein n=1 Tax=Pseudobacter sp. TaxID=2045420 RepID=UPI003F7F429B
MTSVKFHKDIRLPLCPPNDIPHIVQMLAQVLNQREMNVRKFAIAEGLSPSKVYNWFSGKAQPKKDSIEAIMRFFKKIHFKYKPEIPITDEGVVQDMPAIYKVNKKLHSPQALDSQDMKIVIKDIHLALRIQTEQLEFIRHHLLRLSDKVNTVMPK